MITCLERKVSFACVKCEGHTLPIGKSVKFTFKHNIRISIAISKMLKFYKSV